MIVGTGLTLEKVTDVQLALHQICADESNPRSMTAHIMAEHGISSSDVMLVCDTAYLAIEDVRERNIRAMSPTYSLSDEDGIEPPAAELAAPEELPPRTLADDGNEEQPTHTVDDMSAWADAVGANLAAFGRSQDDVAASETARLRAATAENRARVMGAMNGTA